MSSAVTGKGVPVKVPSRSSRLSVLRLVRMAVAFVVVAGSLGLATVTATAQSNGGSCPSEGADNYSDADEASESHVDDIACLRELGISDDGDTYRPSDDMTRSEMAAFMANAYAALTGMEAPIEDHDFEDVEGDPNADDIARISPNGLMITTGTSATTYSPDEPVIRGHMALFLTRLYKAASGSDAPDPDDAGFTDIGDRPDGEQTAINQLAALGVTTGTSATTYSPLSNVTRQQMASFVARMYRAIDELPDPAEAPGAPTGVEVAISGEDGDALDVSWTAPSESGSSDVTGYVVQWKSGDGDYSEDAQSSVDGTSAGFEDLTQGDTYTFRVAAVSDDGQSDWSDEASGNPAVAPGAVGNLKVVPGNKTLSVTWDAPDNGGSPITGYTIEWRAGREGGEMAEAEGDALGYTVTLTKNEGTYLVTVTPKNIVGVGEPASVSPGSATTPTTGKSTAPSGLKLAQKVADDGAVTVTASWSEPSDTGGRDIANYEIRHRFKDRTTGTAGAWVPASDAWTSVPLPTPLTAVINSEAITVPAENYGDTLEVEVRADNLSADTTTDTGLSDAAKASIVPSTVPSAPAAPTVGVAHNSLQVMWVASTKANDGGSPVTGYKVSYTSGGAATTVSVGADTTTHTFTGLDKRYTYSVTVKAVNANGDSPASVAATGSPAQVPAAPTNVRVVVPPAFGSDGTTPTPDRATSLDVSWGPPPSNGTSAVIDYVVQQRTSFVAGVDGDEDTPASDWTVATTDPAAASITASTRKVRISGLTTGTSYDIQVQARNDSDPDTDANQLEPGGPYAMATATPATVPNAVETIHIASGYRSLTVNWSPAAANGSKVTHYLLRYADNTTSQGRWSADIRVDASTSPLVRVLTGLRPDTKYVVQVRAVNGIGTGPFHDTDSSTDEIEDPGANTGGVPSAPRSVTAVPKTDGDGTVLTVTWSRVTASNGGGPLGLYKAQTSTDGFTWTDATFSCDVAGTDDTETCANNVTKGEITGLTDTTDYYVRVAALANVDGSYGYAPKVKATAVPAAPQGVAVAYDSTATGLKVTWTALSGDAAEALTGYRLHWFPSVAGAAGSTGQTTISDGTAGEYVITGISLTPGNIYTVRLHALNAVGASGGATATAAAIPAS